jgi:hypothetical protein
VSSSPEFGKHNQYDYKVLMGEIEKRKESLNTIQSMLTLGQAAKGKLSDEEHDRSTAANLSIEGERESTHPSSTGAHAEKRVES